MATNVSSVLVDSLPVQVNGTSRSPFDLASAAAGEVNSAGTFRIGGGNDTVGVTLDGSSLAGDKIGSDAGDGGAAAMNSPSVEALTEFNVESSGFKAEFGQRLGRNAQLRFQIGHEPIPWERIRVHAQPGLRCQGFLQ